MTYVIDALRKGLAAKDRDLQKSTSSGRRKRSLHGRLLLRPLRSALNYWQQSTCW